MTKQQTLEQLHSVYSRFCAWTREEVPEYMGGKLQQDIIDALLAAARAIDQLPDEPTRESPQHISEHGDGWEGKAPWFKVGDRVLPLSALHKWYPVHTVTEITERGFRYSHERVQLGTRIGWSEGGETYAPSWYQLAAEDSPLNRTREHE